MAVNASGEEWREARGEREKDAKKRERVGGTGDERIYTEEKREMAQKRREEIKKRRHTVKK